MTVYFIQAGGKDGPIKIGFTGGTVLQRKRDLQVGCPERLRVVGVIEDAPIKVEAQLHVRFNECRISGEWFKPSVSLLDFIDQSTSLLPVKKGFTESAARTELSKFPSHMHVGRLLGLGSSATSNAVKRGLLPASWWRELSREAQRLNIDLDMDAFAWTMPEAAA